MLRCFPLVSISSNILNLQYLFKTYLMEPIKLVNQKHSVFKYRFCKCFHLFGFMFCILPCFTKDVSQLKIINIINGKM